MTEFDIVLNDLRLRVRCEKYKKILIEELMTGHSYIEEPIGIATYNLILTDTEKKAKNGTYIKMIDKWFDNASCDVWIDNQTKTVYMCNIEASNIKWRNLLIQYFACNLFNRLLEERGYIAFHSSCVEKNGNGIAFIAPRNSGKTNCLLNMMNAGFNSVSNDKLAIKYNGLKLNGYGVAQDVSIRMSLDFRNQSQNQKYIAYAAKQGVKLVDDNLLEGNNIHLESVELAHLNNVEQIPTTTIQGIISPKYNRNIKEAKFRLLQYRETIQLLKKQRLPLVHDTTNFLSEAKTSNYVTYDEDYLIDKIAKLDCYEVIQGQHTNDTFVKGIKKILK